MLHYKPLLINLQFMVDVALTLQPLHYIRPILHVRVGIKTFAFWSDVKATLPLSTEEALLLELLRK